jgi:hypothetical protein
VAAAAGDRMNAPMTDAERLARLRRQRDDAPLRYQDGVALAPMTNFQWIEVDFLFQQLDVAQAEVARLNAALAAQQSNQALDELAAETERLGLYPRQSR